MTILKIFPQKILDCGEIKYMSEINMNTNPDYVKRFIDRVEAYRQACHNHPGWKNGDFWYDDDIIEEDKYIKMWADCIANGVYPNKKRGSFERIATFMNVTPFRPCVMINISPDWKGKRIDSLMKKHFQKVIEKYLNESNRYSRWKYCLECGSEGNFLHAHIVAEINPALEKSVMTHINKGNHAVQLRKAWDNMDGGYAKGKLKGKYSIQRVILRTEILRDDKLEYLIEESKPEGHKNKYDLKLTFNNGF